MMTSNTVIANRYQIHHMIGQGGMGTVYRGRDITTDTLIAIKALKPEIVESKPDIVKRFTREGEALRQLNHPNIVAILDSIEENNNYYLIMELVTGGSLADLLTKESRLPIGQVLQIALDLADALTRTHRLKIIHRDLKPANVLLAEDGTPRLTDFGVAQLAGSSGTVAGQIIGTLNYLSPESLEGQNVDARSDIWSFGVLLFEMLAGKRPFDGDTMHSTVRAILTQHVPDLEALRSDAPVALVDLIYRMLEKNKDARIPSVRLVGAELEAIMQGTTTRFDSASIRLDSDVTLRFNTATVTSTPTHQVRHNLPTPPPPFVGREQEITEAVALLRHPENRLLTILAPGGMGKTRLAIEVARQFLTPTYDSQATLRTLHLEDSFDHGVFFVALNAISSPDAIVPTLAEALGFMIGDEKRSPKQQILDYLQEKHVLLVFDNVEHVLSGMEVVADILEHAPRVKVMATSRERLALRAETLYPIAGIDFPEYATMDNLESLAAVKLFMQSARRAQPGFELTPEDREPLVQICRQVQGMPLGIELAAAWVEALSLNEIAEEISRSLDFLETDMRDVPERHRSIRAVFDYSWNLLSGDERMTFVKMSVFRGAFTREAAQEVTNASLRTLTNLVNKSLLRRNQMGRYTVHELLRQYAEVNLADDKDLDAEVRTKHADHYLKMLGNREVCFHDERDRQNAHEIEIELENIKSACLWTAREQNFTRLEPALPSLYIFSYAAGRTFEIAELLEQMLQLWQDKKGIGYAATLIVRTLTTLWGPRRNDVEKSYEHACPIFDAHKSACPPLKRAFLDFSLACIGFQIGDNNRALGYIEEARAIYEEHHHQWWLSQVLIIQAGTMAVSADYEGARVMAYKAFELAKRTNSAGAIMSRSNLLGQTLYRGNEFAAAYRAFEEGLPIARQLGARSESAAHYWWLGRTALVLGNFGTSRQHFEKSLEIYTEVADRSGAAGAHDGLGLLAMAEGDMEDAQYHFETCLATQRAINNVYEIASVLNHLGILCAEMGDYGKAKAYLQEALHAYQQGLGTFMTLETLSVVSRVAIYTKDLQLAARVIAAYRAVQYNAGAVEELVTQLLADFDPHFDKVALEAETAKIQVGDFGKYVAALLNG